MTDTELLDWLADNEIIEGLKHVADDLYDIAFHVAMERGASEDEEPTADDKRKALRILDEEPRADDKRKALRILIERAAGVPESEATDGDK